MSLEVRGIGWVLNAVVIGGCGFQLTTSGASGDDVQPPDAAPDVLATPDAPIDSAPIERKLIGLSDNGTELLQNGPCTPKCFARIDATTGVATPIRRT